MLWFIFFITCSNCVIGQITLHGICDENVISMRDFDITKTSGTWFAVETLGDSHSSGQCPKHEKAVYNEKTISVNVTFIENNAPVVIRECYDTTGIGHINMHERQYTSSYSEYVPYKVLATDYKTYAIVYYCKQQNPDYKTVTSWKYSKSVPYLTSRARNIINSIVFRSPELRNGPWYHFDHSDC